MKTLLARARDLLLVAALVTCYLLGRHGVHMATAADAWRDSTAVARARKDSADARWRQDLAASDAAKPDLDSALAAWVALRPRTETIGHIDDTIRAHSETPVTEAEPTTVLDAAIAHAAAVTDSQFAAGDHLARACVAYESSCERARRAAAAAIAARDTLIDRLEHRPPDPAAARVQWFLGGGYDPFGRLPLIAGAASWRIVGPVYLHGQLTRPIAPHQTARGTVTLLWRF